MTIISKAAKAWLEKKYWNATHEVAIKTPDGIEVVVVTNRMVAECLMASEEGRKHVRAMRAYPINTLLQERLRGEMAAAERYLLEGTK